MGVQALVIQLFKLMKYRHRFLAYSKRVFTQLREQQMAVFLLL